MATAELALVTQTESALAVIESMTPEKLFSPGTIDAILDAIEAEVRSVYTDISTEKGRKAVASLGHKVSRSKTYIDEQRVLLVADEKKRIALIDADGKRSRDRLDSLRDEVLQPLTDWRNAERDRLAGHEAALMEMTNLGLTNWIQPVADIELDISQLESIFASREWEEFSKRATEVKAAALEILTGRLEDATRRAAERAELERLQREAEELAQKEREEAIAKAAREKAEAEAREREEAAARAAEQERQRIEAESREREASILREKEAAEERARKAEADRIAAEAKAVSDAKEAAERAEVARVAAEQKAEDERKAAEARQKQVEAEKQEAIERAERERIAAEERRVREAREAADKAARDAETARVKAESDRVAAVEAERKRVEDERLQVEAEAKAREKDRNRRADVHSVALYAFVDAGLDQETAKKAVTAIAKGKIPNVKISY